MLASGECREGGEGRAARLPFTAASWGNLLGRQLSRSWPTAGMVAGHWQPLPGVSHSCLPSPMPCHGRSPDRVTLNICVGG